MADALLTFDNVDVTFPRRGAPVEALKGISFEVKHGGSLGIIGDSGAGKSTICRVAEGLVRPSAGRIVIDGVGTISCSFGVAQFEEGDTPDTLMARADEAMYEAKVQGRNRVAAAAGR